MKNFILVLPILLYTPSAPADELFLDINGRAWHDTKYYKYKKKTYTYNENNIGLGATYGLKYIEFAAGYYRNSFNQDTFYGGTKVKYDLKYKDFTITPGLAFALATGYENTPIYANTLQPILIPTLRLTYKEIGITFGYIPKTEEAKGNNFSTAAITAQLNILIKRN